MSTIIPSPSQAVVVLLLAFLAIAIHNRVPAVRQVLG